MSNRLTTTKREELCEALLNHSFAAKIIAAKLARSKIGDEVYLTLYTKEQRAHMEALPEDFFELADQLGNNDNMICFSTGKRISKADAYRRWQFKAPPSKALKQYEVANKTVKELQAQRKALAAQIKGVLTSVTTWKKLYEIWPEARDVIAKFDTSDTANLPAVIPQTLNSELGLP